MKKERNINKLLKLLLKQVKGCEKILFFGMCAEVCVMSGMYVGLVDGCKITMDEARIIEKYIKSKIPKGKEEYDYWWKSGVKKYRIEWLKKEILKTSKI